MARVKGGLGAKKKHNRTLKLAKGYRGARSKQYRVAKAVCHESLNKFLCRQKREEETVPSVMDRTYQRSCKNEWYFLQPDDARIKGSWCGHQPQDVSRDGCKRRTGICSTGRAG